MRLEALIKNPKLPSLPEVFIQLNQLVGEKAAFTDIAAVISTDPGLSVRILELANSAWFNPNKKIDTINAAVTNIGTTALQQLVLATTVTRIFQGIDVKLVNMKSFWQQSLEQACHAQAIASHIKNKEPIKHFTCGLLCYIGKLVLYIVEPGLATKILVKCKEEQLPQYIVENEMLGFNHSDISAELLQSWKLPPLLYKPLKYYLYPSKLQGPDQHTAAILNTAQYIQSDVAKLTTQITTIDKEVIAALRITGLSQDEFEDIRNVASQIYTNSASLVGL